MLDVRTVVNVEEEDPEEGHELIGGTEELEADVTSVSE